MANYELSAKFSKRIKDVNTDQTVSPKWIGKGNLFWYRKEVKPNLFSFMFVDPEQGIRQPAFDHEELAKALNDHGIEVDESGLPFKWIDFDGKDVKFRLGEKKWQFSDKLTEYEGDIVEETLQHMSKEKVSESSDTRTAVTFKNQTEEPISIYWIDEDGNPKFYLMLKPGRMGRMETYTGHVWRVTKSETDESIASYISQPEVSHVVIEKGMLSMTENIEPVKSDEPEAEPEPEPKSGETTADISTELKTEEAKSEEKKSEQKKSEEKKSEEAKTEETKSEETKSEEAEEHQPHIFIRNYNVWIRDKDQDSPLSTNGTKDNPFDDKIHLSPDGHFAVVYQYTPEQEHTVYKVESSPKNQVQPRLKTLQYLKPGDKIRVDRPRMFSLKEKKEIQTDDTLFQTPYEINDIMLGWADEEYQFFYNQRGHQVIRLLGMNTKGDIRTIIEETSKTFIDYSQKKYLHQCKSQELIWASERDGWNHLYLFDGKTGELKNQITTGEWVVRSVDRVDEDKRQIWLRAFGLGQDPYYAHLVRVDFDGSNLKILTTGDGTHSWKWSPDKKYLVDTWSRVDLAPKTVLRDAEGNEILLLEEGDLESLLKIGWTPAERFEAPGRNETLIYGIIIRPSYFDPNKKYPIIEEIYAGPQDFSVPKAFTPLVKLHELAELGFVVVQIDGMGTNWRSKSFHDYCYKNLKDAGLPDRIAWITAASKTRPWMDVERVGVFGGSAGGQNALSALLWHDFYKVAIADSGCHDNRMDKIWWNEQWMGWPVDQSYEDSSNVVHAGKLKGALMLIVGELDENVDPASTMQVVNALNKAGKDYDLLFIPGGGHCEGLQIDYGIRRQRDFFVRHLMGIEPPNRNAES